jgi:exonuclease VII small subunit
MPRGKIIPLEDRAKMLDDVIERYSRGEQIADIAVDYNQADVSIYRYLLADRQEEFRQAQVGRAMNEFEQAKANRDECARRLRTAPDQLELNRYTQLLKVAEHEEKRSQWLLERVLAKIYGTEKQNNQQPVAIQINLNRQEIEVRQDNNQRVIEN